MVAAILDYLAHRIPGYPFKPSLDRAFVEELVADFSEIDVLEEIMVFRWYYENEPLTRVRRPRVALRRWVANARSSPRCSWAEGLRRPAPRHHPATLDGVFRARRQIPALPERRQQRRARGIAVGREDLSTLSNTSRGDLIAATLRNSTHRDQRISCPIRGSCSSTEPLQRYDVRS